VLWRERVYSGFSWLRIGNHDGPCETKVNIMAVMKRKISPLAENGSHNFTPHKSIFANQSGHAYGDIQQSHIEHGYETPSGPD